MSALRHGRHRQSSHRWATHEPSDLLSDLPEPQSSPPPMDYNGNQDMLGGDVSDTFDTFQDLTFSEVKGLLQSTNSADFAPVDSHDDTEVSKSIEVARGHNDNSAYKFHPDRRSIDPRTRNKNRLKLPHSHQLNLDQTTTASKARRSRFSRQGQGAHDETNQDSFVKGPSELQPRQNYIRSKAHPEHHERLKQTVKSRLAAPETSAFATNGFDFPTATKTAEFTLPKDFTGLSFGEDGDRTAANGNLKQPRVLHKPIESLPQPHVHLLLRRGLRDMHETLFHGAKMGLEGNEAERNDNTRSHRSDHAQAAPETEYLRKMFGDLKSSKDYQECCAKMAGLLMGALAERDKVCEQLDAVYKDNMVLFKNFKEAADKYDRLRKDVEDLFNRGTTDKITSGKRNKEKGNRAEHSRHKQRPSEAKQPRGVINQYKKQRDGSLQQYFKQIEETNETIQSLPADAVQIRQHAQKLTMLVRELISFQELVGTGQFQQDELLRSVIQDLDGDRPTSRSRFSREKLTANDPSIHHRRASSSRRRRQSSILHDQPGHVPEPESDTDASTTDLKPEYRAALLNLSKDVHRVLNTLGPTSERPSHEDTSHSVPRKSSTKDLTRASRPTTDSTYSNAECILPSPAPESAGIANGPAFSRPPDAPRPCSAPAENTSASIAPNIIEEHLAAPDAYDNSASVKIPDPIPVPECMSGKPYLRESTSVDHLKALARRLKTEFPPMCRALEQCLGDCHQQQNVVQAKTDQYRALQDAMQALGWIKDHNDEPTQHTLQDAFKLLEIDLAMPQTESAKPRDKRVAIRDGGDSVIGELNS